MAELYTCHSFCRNAFSISEDEFARKTPIKSSHVSILVTFQTSTLTPLQTPALASILAINLLINYVNN